MNKYESQIISIAEFGETKEIRECLRKSDLVRNTSLDLLYSISDMDKQSPETKCFFYDEINKTLRKYAQI